MLPVGCHLAGEELHWIWEYFDWPLTWRVRLQSQPCEHQLLRPPESSHTQSSNGLHPGNSPEAFRRLLPFLTHLWSHEEQSHEPVWVGQCWQAHKMASQLCNPMLRESGSLALKANLPNVYLGGKPCLYYTGQQRIYLLCSGGRY